MEFEEIRPYHDEELPQVFEELIADPALSLIHICTPDTGTTAARLSMPLPGT